MSQRLRMYIPNGQLPVDLNPVDPGSKILLKGRGDAVVNCTPQVVSGALYNFMADAATSNGPVIITVGSVSKSGLTKPSFSIVQFVGGSWVESFEATSTTFPTEYADNLSYKFTGVIWASNSQQFVALMVRSDNKFFFLKIGVTNPTTPTIQKIDFTPVIDPQFAGMTYNAPWRMHNDGYNFFCGLIELAYIYVNVPNGGTATAAYNLMTGTFYNAQGQKSLVLPASVTGDTICRAKILAGFLGPRFCQAESALNAGSLNNIRVWFTDTALPGGPSRNIEMNLSSLGTTVRPLGKNLLYMPSEDKYIMLVSAGAAMHAVLFAHPNPEFPQGGAAISLPNYPVLDIKPIPANTSRGQLFPSSQSNKALLLAAQPNSGGSWVSYSITITGTTLSVAVGINNSGPGPSLPNNALNRNRMGTHTNGPDSRIFYVRDDLFLLGSQVNLYLTTSGNGTPSISYSQVPLATVNDLVVTNLPALKMEKVWPALFIPPDASEQTPVNITVLTSNFEPTDTQIERNFMVHIVSDEVLDNPGNGQAMGLVKVGSVQDITSMAAGCVIGTDVLGRIYMLDTID